MVAFRNFRPCSFLVRQTVQGSRPLRILQDYRQRHISSLQDGSLLVTRLDGRAQGVVHMELNHPKANALGRDLVLRISDALEDLSEDKTVRAVVVSSRVKGVFCAGADLKERALMPPDEVEPFVSSLRTLMSRFSSLPAPTIAAVDGAAFGGGLELMLACDLRVAGEGATMGLTETSLGIIPGAGGTQRLPRLIGVSSAKELIFSATRVNATRALALGLVNRMVEAGSATAEALLMAEEISKQGPAAVRLAKQAIDRGVQGDLEAGMLVEGDHYRMVIKTRDREEGLRAFTEKRPPHFTGE